MNRPNDMSDLIASYRAFTPSEGVEVDASSAAPGSSPSCILSAGWASYQITNEVCDKSGNC